MGVLEELVNNVMPFALSLMKGKKLFYWSEI